MIHQEDLFGSLQMLKDLSGQTHYLDIRIRLNGKYYWFEGDWLKNIFPHINFIRTEHDITSKLEDHEEYEDNANT